MPQIRLPPDFWDAERERLLGVLLPRIQRATIAGLMFGESDVDRLGIAFDNAMAQARAATWARQHTDNVLNQIWQSNQNVVGQVIENWNLTPGATRRDLVDALQQVFDANLSRANAIAVTENTRAVAQGSIEAYTEAGAATPPMWDDGTGTLRPFGPPLHPRCRCNAEFARHKGQWVVVWYTKNDSLRCQRKTAVPWGSVNGCKDMHGRIISAGEFLGQRI